MQSPQIMLVEDERIVAMHLRQQLTKLGYQVQAVVSSGSHALRQIEYARPDVVLMDIHIEGEMDGIATAAAIPGDYHIPVIYLTAYSEEATLARARLTRPYGYLIKPFSERELHATIQMTLERCAVEAALRISEERLRQSQKMEAIGQLAGGVAHDFNNLLTVMYCNLDELRDHAGNNQTMLETIAEIDDAAKCGATLTQQLLAFSRRQTLAAQVVVIPDLITGFARLLSRTLSETIEVRTDLPPDLWRTWIDPNQLESALLNLALNARDAMPSGGRLTIAAANILLPGEPDGGQEPDETEVQAGHYVLLTVTDTGTGMPQSVVDRAFEPFFTTKPIGRGTGLGLSMVYGFVKQSNGHVKIVSEPDRGTTISIYLRATSDGPLADERNDEAASLSVAKPGEAILVVEDNEAVRNVVVRILRNLGFQTLETNEASTAIALLGETSRIDLLLTDVVLPNGMNGVTLAERARARQPNLKVMYMSGYPADVAERIGALGSGAPLLRKPFQKANIALVVRRMLDG